ncbi:MAG TPA: DUF1501 domain-containing protein [Planctomycetota bacterium]
MSLTRRSFVHLAGGAAAATALPRRLGAFADARGPQDRRLVLLFLEGGNDGLNTVVPFEDDLYQNARPRLGLRDGVVALDAHTALHPSLAPWRSLWDDGRLAVLRDVGYERPNRSHFVSRDIWHSGRREGHGEGAAYVSSGGRQSGWCGRALEAAGRPGLPAVALGVREAPLLLKGEQRSGLTLQGLEAFRLDLPDAGRGARLDGLRAGAAMPSAEAADGAAARLTRLAATAEDAYATAERLRTLVDRVPAGSGYPGTELGERLQLAARLVRAEGGPPVLWTTLGGFDTHAVQPGSHAALLAQLSSATAAFAADLARDGVDRGTTLLIYSEFGRRVRENGSQGTDHGTAGPVFALGAAVRGGLHGNPPDLAELTEGDLRHQHDFRAVFAETAGWMGWQVDGLFDGAFAAGAGRVGYLSG